MPGRALRQVEDTDQVAIDEKHIDDPTVEQALEERQVAKDEMAQYRLAYRNKHEAAKTAIQRLEMPDPDTEDIHTAVRVGRFRITKRIVKGRAVSFETSDRVQMTIGLADQPESEGDDVDAGDDSEAQDEVERGVERGIRKGFLTPVPDPDVDDDDGRLPN